MILSIGVPDAEEESRFADIEGEYGGAVKRTEMTLCRNETGAAGPKLLAGYVTAKFAARAALDATLESVPQKSAPPCP